MKLPLKGTAVGGLAIVADRAIALLTGKAAAPEVPTPDWVVPLRPTATGPGAVVVVDADEHALSATVVAVDRDRVRVVGAAMWPRFWRGRGRTGCSTPFRIAASRLCRRDPRDSAEAEQALFEQLDDAIDRARAGTRINFTVRTDRWFQDVAQHPDDIDGHCSAPQRGAGEAVRDLLGSAYTGSAAAGDLAHARRWPPARAGQGVAHQHARAHGDGGVAAHGGCPGRGRAVPRWLAAELPRAHLDSVIPLPDSMWEPIVEKPAKHLR